MEEFEVKFKTQCLIQLRFAENSYKPKKDFLKKQLGKCLRIGVSL